MKRRATLAAISLSAAACAAIAGLPDRSGTFCAGKAHVLCEDFDNEKAPFVWNKSHGIDPKSAVEGGVVGRGLSPPNAWGMFTAPTPRDAGEAAPFVHRFERSPDGMHVGLSFFIERSGVADAPPAELDAGNVREQTILLCQINWATGIMVLGTRGERIELLYGAWDTVEQHPTQARSAWINSKNTALLGEWISIEITVDLRDPSATITGPDPAQLLTLPLDVQKAADKFTEVLFGTITLGPSKESTILYDNLWVDFKR